MGDEAIDDVIGVRVVDRDRGEHRVDDDVPERRAQAIRS
jgi:hypothetical protein